MDLKNDKNILQNLKDAACCDDFIKKFFSLKSKSNNKLMMSMLYKHKAQLLQTLHDAQKKIDCLDYLIYHLNQN